MALNQRQYRTLAAGCESAPDTIIAVVHSFWLWLA
ncbi:hypothetical protein EHW99_1410 [Erwinia amylovora]|uniref:Uncharacterized protein n=3 Tax=Erwinia amylovora TaxID=552 RepID=A0A831ER69_ERWAM|nr:hypothetical protein EaACW_2189 [Erwinia amylovora ACW56400]QJQ54115.1 hypothetical protein EHX00_1410 [Erwinia amylovora]CBA21211.1 hypothetical protein predicted by Glimmer/Critica [Erwinia amylovora CFBP1430]CBX81051.1 hypothetical protein predicted by Glimmer/Critica [Erwinia amylovora ATCC BAA-2158]CCO79034.1 hypothetical protein BN432_2243 [Erwinia amylovora Ea356]CCO82838.1 hypothetical protein BN433_2274 [Erwinia amylovora Ea266]CCO86610.1 hypothetical protein BN434_2229 [Erwinia a